MKQIFYIIIFIFSVNILPAQYTNFRIHPSGSAQIEPSIFRHQTNPNIMFVSAYTIRNSFRSEGIYVTTDGGVTWFGSDTCSGAPIANHGGDPGPIIDKNGRFILTHQGGFVTGMYANYSNDMGSTWSSNYQIASGDQDKGSPGTDDVSTSSYYGRTYLVWTRFSSPFPIVISYTTNGGLNWTSPIQINNSITGHISLGPSISIGINGQVYVAWSATMQTSPFTEDFLGFAVSSNGGDNWAVQENAYDCNGIKSSQFMPWNIRVNSYPSIDVDKSGGARNGWIYIVTTEKNLSPAGSDPDIIFHRSTNNGTNWSPGIRVNQDALNNGKVQYFPSIRVDENGGVNIVYYDNRNAQADSMGVYISRSIDGGNTWYDFKVNDHWFKPKPTILGGGNAGDNIGITSGNGKLWPVWMDDYNSSVYQVWTASIDINSIGIKKISEEIPEKFSLMQNYPNPFNPKTVINYQLPINKFENVRLIIYNSTGQEITILVDQMQKAGTYEVEFEGTNYPSGVYYYKLTGGEFSETRKMILIK